MTDILWCETCNHRVRPKGEPRFRVYAEAHKVCLPLVRLIESRDPSGRLLGLLVQEECEWCEGSGNSGGSGFYVVCPQCDGSGWRYRASTQPQYWPKPNLWVAVLPLPDKET